MKAKLLIPLVLVLVVVAYVVGRSTGSRSEHQHDETAGDGPAAGPDFWTCSMHPQIKQPKPGKCPICAMELVPVFTGSKESLAANQIELSESAIKLAQILTTPVMRTLPTIEVRMVGKVGYDETRLADITSRFPGRLDRLFVDYTGVTVNKGDHLVEIYSPELLAAQEELLQSIRTSRELEGSSSEMIRKRAAETIEAARKKLLLWDLTAEQIAEIEEIADPSDRLTLYAPMGGVVIGMEALEGKYVDTGAPIYTIADLSRVWIQLDAYETDLVWLHYGQDVTFILDAFPGENFTGRIAFMDPVLNPKTRTVRIRVNMDNTDGRLKPDMFVNAIVRSQIMADGKVMSPEFAGKWISPMHPEIVRDEPGPCPICGMPLVSAESLGYQPAHVDESHIPLVIPATAPLITGKRAVVYVAVKDQPGVFEGRVIELGPRAGDQYIVKSGLQEGDLVVSNGAFKIDSAVQILAKPSMMNPAVVEGAVAPGVAFAAPEAFQEQLRSAIEAYFPVADALGQDKLEAAQQATGSLKSSISGVDMSLLKGDAHMAWMKEMKNINAGIDGIDSATEIEAARTAFEKISNGLIAAGGSFGVGGDSPVYVFHCPMASGGNGADWLQPREDTENPYMGTKMPTCGTQTKTLKSIESTVTLEENTPAPAPAVHNH